MKIIVSHDVDHLNLWEHLFKDSILPKHYIRSYFEFLNKKITFKELYLRHIDLVSNKWNNVKEIIQFNEDRNIKSSFFFGMNNALGLSYDYKDTVDLIQYACNQGFDVGVHGIAFNDDQDMTMEYNRFKEVSGLENFGMRMHYLRNDSSTLERLQKLGYTFDSTMIDLKGTYKCGNLIEFPIHLMDDWVMNEGRRYQFASLEQAKKKSIQILEQAQINQVDYFSFLFHDCYFSDRYKIKMDWYIWFIDYMIQLGYSFVTYESAVKEIKLKNTDSFTSVQS